jgi:hypothetical protein
MGRRAKQGAAAGSLHSNGYQAVKIQNCRYPLHRLAWKWMTGDEPMLIDHINGDRKDNRWSNLREASKSENGANAARSKRNSSGYKGVSFRPERGKYAAYIRVSRTLRHLGYFNTAREASDAYMAAARRYFGVYAKEGV